MILKTMLISGGIAGLVGIGPLLGDPQFHRYGEQFPATLGFTGIAVALVGRNHPVGIAFAALLFAYIERAAQVLWRCGTSRRRSRKIMQGSIILSAVIAFEVVRRVRVAAEVRDAAAKAQPRAAGAVPVGRSLSRCPHEHRCASAADGARRPAGRCRSSRGSAPRWSRSACSRCSPVVRVVDRRQRRDVERHVRRRTAPRCADRAGGARRPVLGARGHRQHRSRGDDDPRHVVRRVGRLAVGTLGRRACGVIGGALGGCCTRSPR